MKNVRLQLIAIALCSVILAGCVGAGNLVWLDENANGLQDAGEPGVTGVQITLYNEAGEALASTVSAADGSYQISLQGGAGNFAVGFELPAGYAFTAPTQGDEPANDSDVNPQTARTALLALSSVVSDVDAGLVLEAEPLAELVEPAQPTATPAATATATAEPAPQNVCYGPQHESFPEGISPLSGLAVSDPSLLELRPVFLSISIFPPSVRPPSGLSVAPIIYELYIGNGDTRLMAGFFGEFPAPDYKGVDGERVEQPQGFDVLIGGRAWFDGNGNNLQDDGEPGVAGVPVRLVDRNDVTVATQDSDADGRYYFGLNDVADNTEYQILFGAPPSIADFYWVERNVGSNDDIDSDVNLQGRTNFFDPTDAENGQVLNQDAGLRETHRIEGLRSGRVAYQDLQVNYCGCLVTASTDPQVAGQINVCARSSSSDSNNIGASGIDVGRLQSVASASTQGSCEEPNLSGNLFCTLPQSEGEPGQELFVEYNVNNTNHFVYDSSLNAYTWAINSPDHIDVFDIMTDRFTGETLTFENVVVLFVAHRSQNPAGTIINLEMQAARGRAVIFRNGQMFEAEWSTQFPAYVTKRAQPIPVHFEVNDEPFALAPGQTWINLLNEGDRISQTGDGVWLADFSSPAYQP